MSAALYLSASDVKDVAVLAWLCKCGMITHKVTFDAPMEHAVKYPVVSMKLN